VVDAGRLRSLLERVREELGHLQRLAGLQPNEVLSDPDLMAAVKYRFIVAIESCIDAGQHAIASEGFRAPADFADVFTVLGEHEVLEPELVPSLQQMARFRNLLVHGYERVDDARVLEILRTRLPDIEAFVEQIAGLADT